MSEATDGAVQAIPYTLRFSNVVLPPGTSLQVSIALDGRAATLAELVDIADAVGMGSTASLTPDQRADLVAYLQSL
jgi:hypothetical protein